MPDIDLDFADRTAVLKVIEHVPAAIIDSKGHKKHNTGVYCQVIPQNPLTGTASIDYKLAEERGYFKLDFLNVSIYQSVKDEQHLDRLLNQEPIWSLLEIDEFTDKLFHVNGHGSILRLMKPKSLEQLAMVLALIRPSKRHLIGQDWCKIENEIWQRPANDEYFFKKAHAYAYAAAVIVHMNLLCEQLEQDQRLDLPALTS